MQSGELNKRIILQQATETSDGMGGFDSVWTDAAVVWAAIWPISASETIRSLQPIMTISTRIRIRYLGLSVLTSAWRVKFNDRYFNIISIVNPSEKNEYLDLICRESA